MQDHQAKIKALIRTGGGEGHELKKKKKTSSTGKGINSWESAGAWIRVAGGGGLVVGGR